MKLFPLLTRSLVVLLLAISVSAYAANVTLDATDVTGTSSFATSLNWSNNAAPTSGNAYYTGIFTLRTTDAAATAQTFAGASLSIDTDGALAFKTDGLITINNLTLNGGTLVQAGVASNTGSTTATLAGSNMTIAADSFINAQSSGRIVLIQSAMSGVGGLTIKSSVTAGGAAVFSANNTYTGATVINSGAILQLGNGGTGGALSSSSSITNNGTLTFNRSNTITQGSGFNSVISGTGELTQEGSGTLVLNGANSYTGTTTVSTGVLNIQSANALGTTAAGTSVTSGAALQIQGGITTDTEALTLNGTGVSTDGALRNISGTNTYAGLVTLGAATRINSDAGTLTLSNAGTITGATFGLTVGGAGNTTIASIIGTTSGALTKDGVGTLTLSGANTYTGATTVSAGALNIQNANALGTTAAGTSLTAGAALQIQGDITTAAEALTLRGAGVSNDGALRNISGTNTYAGLVSLASGSRINSDAGTLILSNTGTITGSSVILTVGGAGNTTINSILGFTGNLTKDGSGTLTLTRDNTYNGSATVSEGVLNIQSANALGLATGGASVTAGAALQIQGDITTPAKAMTLNGTGVSNDGALRNISGTNTYAGLVTLGSASRINSDAGTLTLSNTGTITGPTRGLTIGGAGNTTIASIIGTTSGTLTKDGAGTLTLTGANTLTGTTTVNEGALQLSNSLALQYSSLDTSGLGVVTLSAVTAPTLGGLIGSSNLASVITTGYGSVTALTLNPQTGVSNSYAGVLSDGAAGMTVTKSGVGTQVLSGANTYTGATTVSAGVLNIQNANALGGTTAGTSVTSGAVLQIQGGITVGAEALTLAGTGEISTGALRNISGDNTYQGLVTLAGATRINSVAGTLTLSNTGTITGATFGLMVGGAGNTTIASIIGTTSGTLTKDAAGTLTLSGANTFTGATTVSGGVLNIQNADALGTTASGTSVTSGAALQIQGDITTAAEELTLAGTGVSTTGALRNIIGTNTYAGLVTLGAATRINSDAGTLTLSNAGTITGATFGLTVGGAGNTSIASIIGTTSGTLTKDGAGTLTLTGANTYTGATALSAGVLNIQNANALGTTAAGTSLTAGAALQIQGDITTAAEALTLRGAGVSNDGALRNISGTNTYAGLVNLGTNSRINSDAGTLILSNAGTITGNGSNLTVGGAGNTTIASIIGTTTGALTKDGAGTLELTGANTYTGVTTVNAGVLNIQIANALGTTALGTSVTAGAALQIQGDITTEAEALTLNGTGVSSDGALRNISGTNTYAGLVALGSASRINSDAGTLTLSNTGTILGVNRGLTVGGAGNTTIASIIGTAGGTLTKDGAGTLTLSGASTYTGATTVSTGVLNIRNANALGTTAAGTTVASGAALQIQGSITTAAEALTLNGTGVSTDGALRNISGLNTYAGLVTLGAASRINSDAGTLTLSNAGTITGATFGLTVGGAGNTTIASIIGTTGGTLTKDGAGTLELTGANTFTGATTVSAGILNLRNATGLGTAAGGTTVSNGATLQLQGSITVGAEALSLNGGAASGQTGALVNVSGTNTYGGAITVTSSSSISAASGSVLNLTGGVVKNGTVATFNGGGTINVSTVAISGASADSDLVIDGTTVNVDVASTYNGPTFIRNSGTLNANVTDALPTANGRTAVTFDGTGTSVLTLGAAQSVASLTSAGAATVTLGANTLTMGTSIGSTSFAGIIGGTGGLTKDGASTQVLTGSNAYTGTTTISAGTLVVNGSIGTSSLTTINGGTLSGTGTVGAIQLNSGGTLNVGAGTLSTGNISVTDGQLVISIGSTSSYGQLNTSGTVNLTDGGSGAQLVINAISGYTPQLGDSFTLIVNDLTDAISGSFIGLTEGQKIANFLGSAFAGQISYLGGTGNDVVLMVVSQGPTVSSLSPSIGSTAGGKSVTLTGTDFTGTTGVTIGGAAATSVTVVNSTTITAVTPAGTAGTASVVVTTADGSSAANTLYTYVTPPTVSANLVAQWVADDWAGSTNDWVDRIGGKVATVPAANNSPTKTASGLDGRTALVFDGVNDYLRVSAAENPIVGKTSVTIVAHFNATLGASGADGPFWRYPGPLNAESGGSPNDWGLTYDAAGNAAGFFNDSITHAAPVSLLGGQPHTMILTWKDPDVFPGEGVARLYVDGVLAGSTESTDGGAGIVNDAFVIGSEQEELLRYFTGAIRELRFYDAVLDPVAIDADLVPLRTLPATLLTGTTGTLNGRANPQGVSMTAWFEYGTDPALTGAASTTAQDLGSGSSPVFFNQGVTGLAGDTKYYFRAVTNTGGSTTFGSILSFSTGPEIALEQPAGTDLTDGAATVGFGNVPVGIPSAAKTFTIKNTGDLDLTGIAVTIDGTFAGDYLASAPAVTTVPPGGSTTFTVTFTPGAAGLRAAALHIASNDANENPFDLVLGGTGVPTTIWTGPRITFTKGNYADWNQEENQDRLTPAVWLTRQDAQGIYNIATEGSFNRSSSPADTEWAYGTTANLGSLTFRPWTDWHGGNPPNTVNQDAVLHLISENIYIDIKFTFWQNGQDGGGGGGFSYSRSTPAAAPEITSPTSTSITAVSATLGGDVTSDGGAPVTERGVVYALTATNSNPQIGGTGVTKAVGTGTTGVFTVAVSGLSASTGYSYAAYATNAEGTSYTSVGTFTTTTSFVPGMGVTVTYSGVIGGTAPLSITSGGTLELTGPNTYTADTNVQNGTVSLNTVGTGTTAQSLGQGSAVNLGLAGTSSGSLVYTGGAGTLDKTINALGNGSDTVQNAGTGLLTLSGTLNKNGTVLNLQGGTNGITVTGSITGNTGSPNSDLIIDGGIITLASANTYNGPTYIINGGTLNADAVDALPTNPARSAILMDQSGSGSSTLALGVSQAVLSLTGAGTSSISLNANTLTIGDSAGSTTFAGIIGGTGGLIKDGASTQVLNGANTYTGTTTISAGNLTLQSTNASSAYVIAGGATLEINNAGNLDFGTTTYSGTGTFKKTGAGEVVWGGSSATFALGSGSLIDVQEGTMVAGNFANEVWTSNLSDLTVASGATYDGLEANIRVNALNGAGTIKSGYGGAGYQDFSFGVDNGGGSFSGVLTDSHAPGNYTKVGSGTQILSGANAYTGATTISAGVLNIQNTDALGTIAAGTSVTSGAALQIQGNITTAAEALTLNGTGVSSDGALRNISGTNTYAGLVTLGSASRINSDAGTLTLSNAGTITGSGLGLTVGGAGDTTIASVIGTGSGSLTKDGAGTLTLTASSTFSGGLAVNAGTVRLLTSGFYALPTSSAVSIESGAVLSADQTVNNHHHLGGVLTLNGGTLTSINGPAGPANDGGYGNFYLKGVVVGGSFMSTISATTVTFNSDSLNVGNVAVGTDLLVSSSIIYADGASLIKTGNGTMTLTGANTYTADTTISAGTLQIGNEGTTGSLSASSAITNNGTLAFNRSNTITQGTDFNSVISGTGAVTQEGSGTLVFNGVNTYTGTTTVISGTLLLGANAPSGSSGALGNASSAVLVGNSSGTADAALLTNGAFTIGRNLTIQSGNTGVISLGGDTAGTSIFTGNVSLGTAGETAKSVTLVAAAGGSVDFQGIIDENTSVPSSGIIIGDGTHTGTVKLSNGANAYGGSTTISKNTTLELASLTPSGSPSTLGNSGNSSENLIINGGTLKYTGTGGTTNRRFTFNVDGATVDASATGNGALTFTGVSALAASGSGDRALTLTGTSTGDNAMGSPIPNPSTGVTNLTKSGVGTWVLSGTNTYTGATTVSAGILNLRNATGLGTAAGGTTVSNGATLQLQGGITVGAEALSLNGGAASGQTGALVNVSGTNTYGGAITVTSSSSISAASGSVLNLTGGVVKNGTVATFNGGGTINVNTVAISGASADSDLVIDGTTVNVDVASTYNGPTFIRNSGTLNANVTDALPTANGRTAVTFDGTGTSVLTLGAAQSVASLTSAGAATVTLGANTLTMGTSIGSTSFAGIIGGTGGLTKDGASTQVLTGSNAYTGTTTISAGTLVVNGSIGTSSLTTINGGTLSGTGTVGAIQLNSGGTLNVGAGTLSTGNISVTDGQLVISIGSTSSYGQLNTSGTINLTNGGSGAQLVINAISGYTPQLGDSFTLIVNDLTDAISGSFIGLTEGQKIANFLGSTFAGQISYLGGSGNDVVMTVVSQAPTVTSLSPSSGSTTGGTSVTLTGTDFTGTTGVTIGGAAATSVTVVNSTTITAVTPAGTAGTASVIVTTAGGSNAANTLYTFVALPEITITESGNGVSDGGTYDFGNVDKLASTVPLTKTFTIKNDGVANLTGIVVNAPTGSAAADYTVNTTGTASSLAPASSTTFTMTFNPSRVGTRVSAIVVDSNDLDENPFNIALTGVGSVARDVTDGWTVAYAGPDAPGTLRNGMTKAVAVQKSTTSDTAVAVFATGYTSSATGGQDIYTAKYDPVTGALLWDKTFNGAANLNDQGAAIAVDSSGNVVITGYTTKTSTDADVYVAKYASADGALLWQKTYAGTGGNLDAGVSVAVDASDNVAVAGYGFSTAGGMDFFAARYSSDGATTYFEKLIDGGSSRTDSASSVAVNSAGDLAVAGYIRNAANNMDFQVMKLDATAGTTLWQYTFNGSSNTDDGAYSVAFNAADDVIATGFARASNYDLYTVKLSGSGVVVWQKQWNGPFDSSDTAYQLAIDSNSDVIVGGTSYRAAGVQDGYVVKYSGVDGSIVWDSRFNGSAGLQDLITSVAIDKLNNVVATGYSQNAAGNYDVLTAKMLATDGGLLWERRYDGTVGKDDSGAAVAVSPEGNVFVAGYSTEASGTTNFLVKNYQSNTAAVQAAQTITFANPGAQIANVPLTLVASASSGQTVHFTVVSGSAALADSSNTLLNFTGIGSVTVRATQSGNSAYAAASAVDQTFTVSKAAQTISFLLPASLSSTAQWPLTGVATSGLAVTYNVQSGPGSITDGVLSFSGAGAVTVRASQAGDGRFDAATDVDAVVTSQNTTPVVIFDNIIENWRDTYAGSGAGAGNDIALQLSGNDAVAGFVAGYTTTSGTGKDLYLAKYLANGTLVWSVVSGTSGDDEGLSVVVDGNGDVVVAGYVTGTGRDLYVAKHNGATGSKIWDYTYSGTGGGNDVGASLALDGSTNVVVGGYAVGSGTSNDFFAAKLDLTTGALVWASVRNRTGATSDVPAKVAVGTDGSVALAGATNSDTWTVKLAAADGALVWQNVYNFTNKPDAVRGLALDAANNVIITAYSQGSNYDIYTAKYASLDGTLIWGKRYNSSFNSSDHPWDLVVDEDSNVYVTGASYRSAGVRDGMTLKYAGLNGTLMWEGRYNGTSGANDENFTLSLDGIGNPVISGYTTNSDGTTDVYLAKHNKVPGTIRWQNTFDGANNKNDNIQKVRVDPNGNVWMAGSATGLDGKLVILILRHIPTP